MRYGYARVSTKKQILDRQIDMLKQKNVDEIITETASGGGRLPELEKLILRMKKGDILIVSRLSRLGRSALKVLNMLSILCANGIEIIAIDGGKVDTMSPHGKYLWGSVALYDELQRDFAVMRTKEGLESARKKGRLLGRPSMTESKKREVILMNRRGLFSKQQIANACGICRTSVYKIINEYEENNNP